MWGSGRSPKRFIVVAVVVIVASTNIVIFCKRETKCKQNFWEISGFLFLKNNLGIRNSPWSSLGRDGMIQYFLNNVINFCFAKFTKNFFQTLLKNFCELSWQIFTKGVFTKYCNNSLQQLFVTTFKTKIFFFSFLGL